MAIIQFQPSFDAAVYHKAKGKGRDPNVASHSESNKRSLATLKSRPGLIETESDDRIPPIEEAFLRRLTEQSETPTN